MSPSNRSSTWYNTVDSAKWGALFFSERCVRTRDLVFLSTTLDKNWPVWSFDRCPPLPEIRSFSEFGYGPFHSLE